VADPQIKISLSVSAASIVYAFVCQIRLSRKARELSDRLSRERPELWSELNAFARNWHGGLPGLKNLHRRNVVGLPKFNQKYEALRILERKMFWGIGIGSVGIGLVIIGTKFWGWIW
jgi:hypothetical protein